MTRSAFTVFSALVVACDKATGGCGAAIGKRCTAKSGLEMAHCHTSRRKAADAQRTREVNPELASHSMTTKFTMRFSEAFAQGIRDGLASVDLAVGKDRAAIMCLSCYREDCEHVSGVLAEVEKNLAESNPPSYLPTREPLSPRVFDLNPDERRDEHHASCDCGFCPIKTQWTTDELAAHDAEKAIDEAKWLAESDAEIAAGIVPTNDGSDLEF